MAIVLTGYPVHLVPVQTDTQMSALARHIEALALKVRGRIYFSGLDTI